MPAEWRHIATAPKDREIVVWMHDDAPHRAWQGERQSGPALAQWTPNNGGGWASYRAGTPTFWLDLPPLPSSRPDCHHCDEPMPSGRCWWCGWPNREAK